MKTSRRWRISFKIANNSKIRKGITAIFSKQAKKRKVSQKISRKELKHKA